MLPATVHHKMVGASLPVGRAHLIASLLLVSFSFTPVKSPLPVPVQERTWFRLGGYHGIKYVNNIREEFTFSLLPDMVLVCVYRYVNIQNGMQNRKSFSVRM